MTKKKRKYHNYKNSEIVYRQWFPAKTLLKDFLKGNSTHQRTEFINRIGINHKTLIDLEKPDYMIRANTADKYAIRLGYHPCTIWLDWFQEEPKEGSNPAWAEKKKQLAKAKSCIVYTDTNQPLDYNLR